MELDKNNTRALKPVDGTFDFKSAPSFALPYLRTYYMQPPTIDETVLSKFIVENYGHLAPNSKFIEIGCGPTLHHALIFAPRVAQIHMADYLEENLDQVRLWKDKAPSAHDWRAYTELTLKHENAPARPGDIDLREELVRSKITAFKHCDLKQDVPQADQGKYDAVGCFYCAEEVGISQPEWRKVMARVVSYLAPEGTLFMAALAGMDYYDVRNEKGETLKYPCARVTEAGVREVLHELGFSAAGIKMRNCEIEHADCGLAGTLMLLARREGLKF